MDQEEKIEKLNQLADELHAAANARPYDPDNYNRIVDELNALWPAKTEPSTEPKARGVRSRGHQRISAAAARLKKILKEAWSL